MLKTILMVNSRAVTVGDHWRNILMTYGVVWFWVALVVGFSQSLLGMLGVPSLAVSQAPVLSVIPFLTRTFFPDVSSALTVSPIIGAFMAVIFAPVFEEIVFRLFPLTLTFGTRKDITLAVQLAVCGVLFGIAHGHPFNVIVQGMVGFMLGRLYVANSSSMFNAWASCALVHALYNATVLLTMGG